MQPNQQVRHWPACLEAMKHKANVSLSLGVDGPNTCQLLASFAASFAVLQLREVSWCCELDESFHPDDRYKRSYILCMCIAVANAERDKSTACAFLELSFSLSIIYFAQLQSHFSFDNMPSWSSIRDKALHRLRRPRSTERDNDSGNSDATGMLGSASVAVSGGSESTENTGGSELGFPAVTAGCVADEASKDAASSDTLGHRDATSNRRLSLDVAYLSRPAGDIYFVDDLENKESVLEAVQATSNSANALSLLDHSPHWYPKSALSSAFIIHAHSRVHPEVYWSVHVTDEGDHMTWRISTTAASITKPNERCRFRHKDPSFIYNVPHDCQSLSPDLQAEFQNIVAELKEEILEDDRKLTSRFSRFRGLDPWYAQEPLTKSQVAAYDPKAGYTPSPSAIYESAEIKTQIKREAARR